MFTRTQIGAILVVVAAMVAIPVVVVDAMNWRGGAVQINQGFETHFICARWMSLLATLLLLLSAIALLIRIDRRGLRAIEGRTLRTGIAMVLRGVLMLGAFAVSLSVIEAMVVTQSLSWLGGSEDWKRLEQELRPQAVVGALTAVCGTALCILASLRSSGGHKVADANRGGSFQFTLRGMLALVFLCAVLTLGVRLGAAVSFALLFVLSATLIDYLLLCRPCFEASLAVSLAMQHWIISAAAMADFLLLFGVVRAALFGVDPLWAFSGAAYAALVGLSYAATD